MAFKEAVVAAAEGDTVVTLKKLTPVRLIKNSFYQKVYEAENTGASKDELENILGRARAKQGMFEGNIKVFVHDKEELDELVLRLKQLGGIHSVDRFDTEELK